MNSALSDSLIGLGRRHAPDHRDLTHPLPKRETARTSRSWASPTVLDQGNTSQCVGYSTWKYLQSGPVVNIPKFTPEQIYFGAQQNDEWPGEDYEGTSVRGAFKLLKKLGYVSEYLWAQDVETIVAHLLDVGPVVMGTSWFMDMFTPDRWNYLWPEGENAGGHAWLLVGADRLRRNPDGTKGAVRMINSWGPRWADAGRAWLSIQVLAHLLADDGEAGVAVELKRAA